MKYICTDEILNIRKKWYANKKPVIFEDLCSNISPLLSKRPARINDLDVILH
jgi:hypothetical protein